MTTYLTVWHDFDGKQVGVLEMRHHIVSGKVIQTFEFVGNGGADGGTWEWVSGANATEAHLTSGIRKSKVAILKSKNWGQINPPAEPWFANAKVIDGNSLTYFMVTGATKHCSWYLKN